jgi:hypothetical protein
MRKNIFTFQRWEKTCAGTEQTSISQQEEGEADVQEDVLITGNRGWNADF